MSNLPESTPLAAALKYLEFSWDQALWSQESIVYKVIGEQALGLIEDVELSEHNGFSHEQISDIQAWKTNIGHLIESYGSEYLNKMRRDAEEELFIKYANSMLSKGLLIYAKPTFLINCTESVERLAIQKKYDTQREALLMTNDEGKISFSDVEALRVADGRKIYRGCVLIDNHLSIDAELRELSDAGDAVLQRKTCLPDAVGELVGLSPAGVPFGREDSWEWDEYFLTLGYKRAEDLAQEPETEPVPVSQQQLQQEYPLQYPQQPNAPPPAPANSLLLSRHGRPNPYQPTPQPTLKSKEAVNSKYGKTKGKPPGGVDYFEYDLAYNRADSKGRHMGKTLEVREADRVDLSFGHVALEETDRGNISSAAGTFPREYPPKSSLLAKGRDISGSSNIQILQYITKLKIAEHIDSKYAVNAATKPPTPPKNFDVYSKECCIVLCDVQVIRHELMKDGVVLGEFMGTMCQNGRVFSDVEKGKYDDEGFLEKIEKLKEACDDWEVSMPDLEDLLGIFGR
ncbi:hypothetical protein BKA65DRAFT_579307 [Rhexocercosporidium sp. MPI-PUGE-AT-0058]|nr:hypothetical protein BKA65DRAFT_579307 [Rhexocercosporidium sp. MPI-PUGE-AT-0058]